MKKFLCGLTKSHLYKEGKEEFLRSEDRYSPVLAKWYRTSIYASHLECILCGKAIVVEKEKIKLIKTDSKEIKLGFIED